MQNLSADIEDEKQSKYLVVYTKLDDFGKETEQTNKTAIKGRQEGQNGYC